MEKHAQKKILYIVTKSNFGGAQRYVFDLATSAKKQHNVSVAFGGAGLLKTKLSEKNVEGITLKYLQKNIHPTKDFFAIIELYKLCRKMRPDTLHLNSSKAGILGAIAGAIAGVENIVFTSHGLVADENRNFLSKIILRTITWLTFLLSDKVVLISTENKKRADKMLFIENKTRLIHNATAATTLLKKKSARTHIVSLNKSVPKNGVWIGTISELTPNKGLTKMILAVQVLIEKDKNIHFIIFGEGEQRTELEQLITSLKIESNVHLLGFVDNARIYLPALDIFTLTSQKEGHPYALLEAAGAKLPVVASNISGITDIITDKQTGRLIDPNNHHTIADAITDLLDNQQIMEHYAETLKKTASELFSIEKMITNTISLY